MVPPTGTLVPSVLHTGGLGLSEDGIRRHDCGWDRGGPRLGGVKTCSTVLRTPNRAGSMMVVEGTCTVDPRTPIRVDDGDDLERV